MSKRFEDKVILVTGGTGNIGKAAIKLFYEEGGKVAAVGTNDDKLKKLQEEFEGILTIKADVTKEEDAKRYVAETVEKFGKLDIAFLNAGIVGPVNNIEDMPLEDFKKTMDINVDGVFLGMKYVIPEMKKNGGGSIINTSSVAGLGGSPGLSQYVASKHAVIGLTKSAAKEVGQFNIRVNSVHPSPVDNEMMRGIESGYDAENPEAVKAAQTQMIPLRRYAVEEDVAKVVAFLASDDSAFVTGSQYRIDGGMMS